VRPLWQVFQEAHEKVDAKQFLPAVAGYFADTHGNLQGCRSTCPRLSFSTTRMRSARRSWTGEPPKTWYEMPKAMGALLAAGYECVYTTPGRRGSTSRTWSTWHNRDFATTRTTGLAGLDATRDLPPTRT
jgi:sn-glycerol 3-phosphate transport system substrate-binding protein